MRHAAQVPQGPTAEQRQRAERNRAEALVRRARLEAEAEAAEAAQAAVEDPEEQSLCFSDME